jgi:hypothetical protein
MLYVYLLLGILIATLELPRRFSGQPLDAMTAFNSYYFVLFVFVPINVIWLGEDVVRQKYAYETFGSGDAWTALALLFSYVLFHLGYWAKSPKSRKIVGPGGGTFFPLPDSLHVAKITFLFGALLLAIYVAQLGGILEAISKASEVRSGEFLLEGKYLFYRHFMQFSADAFVLLVAVIIGKRFRKFTITWSDKLFLFCAFLVFVFFALTTGGRRSFIYPITICYLVYSSMGGHLRKMFVVVLLLISIIAGLGTIIGPIVVSGSWSTVFELADINDANWRGLSELAYDNATQGLADSYIHFVGAQKASLWQFGFLTDIVNLPRDFFPSRLLGFQRTLHMYGDTTEYFTGQALEDVTGGGEPLGLHGYLLVNFGYAGMFVMFFFLGLFYKWIHNHFKPAESKDAVGWLVYWWVVLAFFVYFREGVLLLVIKEQLTWWAIIALLLRYRAKQRAAPRLRATSGNIRSFSNPEAQQT